MNLSFFRFIKRSEFQNHDLRLVANARKLYDGISHLLLSINALLINGWLLLVLTHVWGVWYAMYVYLCCTCESSMQMVIGVTQTLAHSRTHTSKTCTKIMTNVIKVSHNIGFFFGGGGVGCIIPTSFTSIRKRNNLYFARMTIPLETLCEE